MKKLLILTIFFLFTLNAFAQYVDNGQDAASISWRYIETKDFKLIYPEDSETLAQKFANLFQSLYAKEYSSLNHKPCKMPIILHSHGGISNGMVLWAPRRMELFTSSMQHNDFVSFTEHLGIHEYRHVVQIDKMNQGLTKFGSIIFGEHAPIGVMGVYVPMWFLEGDAVAFETGNTKGGRGRLPSFEQELRALLVEKGAYSYDKAVFGSFNDFTPNKYTLGYYMIANARKHYGTKIWENTINEMARKPWNIYCFENGMSKGFMPTRDTVWKALAEKHKIYNSRFLNVDSLLKSNKHADPKLTMYSDNMCELESKWSYEDREFRNIDYDFKNKSNKLYASYKYSQKTDRGSIIAYKNDFNDINAIVEIDKSGNESILLHASSILRDLDYSNDLLAWSEYKAHLRWENAGKTILAIYDINKKKYRRYKYKDNLFNPCISKEGQIALISENSICETSLLSFNNGKFVELLRSKGEEVLQMPTWVNENELAYIVLDEKGKRIELLDIETKERIILAGVEESDIANPEYWNGKIYYSSSYSGKDEICSVDIKTGEKFIVSNARFGNRFVDIKDGKLLYSSYTADGYQIKEDAIKERAYGSKAKYALADIMTEQEKPELLRKDSISRVFGSKKYSKMEHLFKVHSWAPLFVNGFDRTVEGFADLGVSIASQNDLSTMFMVAGYKRDIRYNEGAAFAQMKYKSFWPIFDIKADVGIIDADANQNAILIIDKLEHPGVLDVKATRTRTNLSSKMSLPFNLSKGAYIRGFEPYMKYEYIYLSRYDFESAFFYGDDGLVKDVENGLVNESKDISVSSYNIFLYNVRKKALRDLNPKWGQILEAGYISSTFGDDDFGRSIYASLKLYTPGLLKNHSFTIYVASQVYSLSSFIRNIEIPKGISLNGDYKDVSTIKASYKLPICYPDYSLGGLMYMKRLYANLFYERVLAKTDIRSGDYYSTGLDIRANVHFLRFKTPVNIGLRGGYESQTKSPFFEFLFNLSFDI
jgi:hypothetical protein